MKQTKKKKSISKWSIPLQKSNFIIFFIGAILLFVGFYIMTLGDWDSKQALIIAPIILLISYFLIFPFGILYKKNNKNNL